MGVRKLIREEIHKLFLFERRQGYDVVVKISNLLIDRLVDEIFDSLSKGRRSPFMSLRERIKSKIYTFKDYGFDASERQIKYAIGFCSEGFDYTVNLNASDLSKNTSVEIINSIKVRFFVDYSVPKGTAKYSNMVRGTSRDSEGFLQLVISAKTFSNFIVLVAEKLSKGNKIDKSFIKNNVITRPIRQMVVHELQHFYDDIRDDRDVDIRLDGYPSLPNGRIDTESDRYWLHPLEVNAYFTQVVDGLDMGSDDWNTIKRKFTKHPAMSKILKVGGNKIRKYYFKRLYTLWSQVNGEMNDSRANKR